MYVHKLNNEFKRLRYVQFIQLFKEAQKLLIHF